MFYGCAYFTLSPYRLIDVDVWPGPEPATITAHILGGKAQLIDARIRDAEDATQHIHGSICGVHKTSVIADNCGSTKS